VLNLVKVQTVDSKLGYLKYDHKLENIDEVEIYNLHDLIVKLHDLQKTKLNTYYMSWDIVNGKVLEFSVTATLQHPPHYYDINTKKKVIPRRWGLGTLEYLINEYIK